MSFESIDKELLKKNREEINNSKLFGEDLILYSNGINNSELFEIMKRGYIEMSQINLALAEESEDDIVNYETWLCGV